MTSLGAKLRVAAVVIGLAWAGPVALVAIFGGTDSATTTARAPSGRLTPPEAVSFWKARTQDQPSDYIGRTLLAASQLRLARSSGDGDYYLDAAKSARSALAINADYGEAISALGAAQLAQHDFVGARDLALDALDADPDTESALALLGDASFEIGDIDVARDAYRKLLEQGQSPAVLSRQARLVAHEEGPERGLELAERALEQAIISGLTADDEAFYRIQVASYRFGVGDLHGATTAVDAVLIDHPDQPLALFWRARLLAAIGDLDGAALAYEQGLSVKRHPEFVAELADVRAALGDAAAASALLNEAVESAGEGALDADGPLAGTENRHLVQILADHAIDTSRAVDLATAELETVRQDGDGYDALAWALFADGRLDDAVIAMDKAIASGADGPEALYHAASIAAARGNTDRAVDLLTTALEVNPHFDLLHAAWARELLVTLSS